MFPNTTRWLANGIVRHCNRLPVLLSTVDNTRNPLRQAYHRQHQQSTSLALTSLQRHLFSTTANETTPSILTTPLSASSASSSPPHDDDIPLPAPPVDNEDLSEMTNEQLADTSTIPGWHLIHSPPRKFPRGALVGTVVSDKMQKTVNVAVDRYRIVPKIRKRIKYTRKFMAHDEQEVARMGDVVMITPCHRISKHKHFLLREIIRPKGQLS